MNDKSKAAPQINDADAARQDALEKLGLMGEYVAPSMMVLMNSKASAATVTSGSTN